MNKRFLKQLEKEISDLEQGITEPARVYELKKVNGKIERKFLNTKDFQKEQQIKNSK